MNTTMMTKILTTAAALTLCACAANPYPSEEPTERPAAHAAGAVSEDAGAAEEAASPVAMPSPQVADAGAAEASVPSIPAGCAPLGAPCATSSECLCSKGSGCEWDNVECRAGTCQLENKCVPDGSGGYSCDGGAGPLLPQLDAGAPCCSRCELDYDHGTIDLNGWLACNASCHIIDGFCPVTCLAADTHL